MKKIAIVILLLLIYFVNNIFSNSVNNFTIYSYQGNIFGWTTLRNHDYCVVNNTTGDTVFANIFCLCPQPKFYCINHDTLIDITIKSTIDWKIVPSNIIITKYKLSETNVKLIDTVSICNNNYRDICVNDFYSDDIKISMSGYIDLDDFDSEVKKLRFITISKNDLSIIEDLEYIINTKKTSKTKKK